MVTNVALAGTMIALVGVKAFLCICRSCSCPRPPAFGCPTFSISLSINSDSKGENWKLHDAALHGSSHYDLPGVLRWFTAIIGACAKHAISAVAFRSIGCARCFAITPSSCARLTLAQSIGCVRLNLMGRKTASTRLI
jgi:acyl-lipid omega-6 desaturase (Delta-12 desaturase)